MSINKYKRNRNKFCVIFCVNCYWTIVCANNESPALLLRSIKGLNV